MEKFSLRAKLAEMPMSKFSFVDFRREVSSADSDGNKVDFLIFTLAEPIDKVVSSTFIANPDDASQRVHPYKENVVEVKVKVELIEKALEKDEPDNKWVFDLVDPNDPTSELTKTGSYSGDLILDLSGNDEVWLTDVKFSKFGQNMRNEKNKARWSRYAKN